MSQQVTSKEKILKNIRQGLTQKSKALFQDIDLESNVFVPVSDQSLAEAFARKFTLNNGSFIYCDNQFDCIDKLLDLTEANKWKQLYCAPDYTLNLLTDAGIEVKTNITKKQKVQAGITGCESLIARTGTLLLSNIQISSKIPALSLNHIVIAKLSQLVADIKSSLLMLKNKYGKNLPSDLVFISGPSKTYAIPQLPQHFPLTVRGAIGPEMLYLFLINDIQKSF